MDIWQGIVQAYAILSCATSLDLPYLNLSHSWHTKSKVCPKTSIAPCRQAFEIQLLLLYRNNSLSVERSPFPVSLEFGESIPFALAKPSSDTKVSTYFGTACHENPEPIDMILYKDFLLAFHPPIVLGQFLGALWS